MKKMTIGIALMAMLIISGTTACGQAKKNSGNKAAAANKVVSKADTIVTEKVEYSDSSKYGYVNIHLELPSGDDAVAKAIHDNLYQKLVKNLGQEMVFMNAEDSIPSYKGAKDVKSMCQYYGKASFKYWNASLKQENDENAEYIRNDSTMSAQEKKDALEDMRQYGFDINLTKSTENSRYVIFNENAYGYTGGAHGGLYGMGDITYDRKTGKEIKTFIKPNSARAMQPLLKQGLKKYFSETEEVNTKKKSMSDSELYDHLMLEGKQIPMPSMYNVSPSKDGIVFLYGQYEIACYAAGMPTFTIPYSQIKPYLTDEAKRVLGIK